MHEVPMEEVSNNQQGNGGDKTVLPLRVEESAISSSYICPIQPFLFFLASFYVNSYYIQTHTSHYLFFDNPCLLFHLKCVNLNYFCSLFFKSDQHMQIHIHISI